MANAWKIRVEPIVWPNGPVLIRRYSSIAC